MASHTDLNEPATESQRNNEDDSLMTERLGEVGERLLTLGDQMSLCNKVLEDLQALQGIVVKRNLQDALLPTPK